ncbi:MAG TPA: TadE family protein [Herpetosiphonaceae bacterium]
MKRKSRGQSLAEFAMVFPLLMAFIFGTIDFGYYIFAWSEIQFAARRAAEQASTLPPRVAQQPTQYHSATYRSSDPCLRLITGAAERSGALNIDTSIRPQDIMLSFHLSGNDAVAQNGPRPDFPMVGQVLINKQIRPLTPLGATVFRGQPWTFVAISRRTIIFDGAPIGGTEERYLTCQQ